MGGKPRKPIHYVETQYGFEYGAARVERVTSHQGAVLIAIRGKHREAYVYVSPAGLNVSVEKRIIC